MKKVKVWENAPGLGQLLVGTICEVLGEDRYSFLLSNNSPYREAGDPPRIWVSKLFCDVVEENKRTEESDYDLPEIMASIILTVEENPEFSDVNVDDFYDFMGISYENRTDFATSALLQQVMYLLCQEDRRK